LRRTLEQRDETMRRIQSEVRLVQYLRDAKLELDLKVTEQEQQIASLSAELTVAREQVSVVPFNLFASMR